MQSGIKKIKTKTMEDRISKIQEMEREFINELSDAGLFLSEYATAYITSTNIEIGVLMQDNNRYFDFGSEIVIRKHKTGEVVFNTGSSGSFKPEDKTAAYWRVVQGAEILRNWHLVKPISLEYMDKIKALEKMQTV